MSNTPCDLLAVNKYYRPDAELGLLLGCWRFFGDRFPADAVVSLVGFAVVVPVADYVRWYAVGKRSASSRLLCVAGIMDATKALSVYLHVI